MALAAILTAVAGVVTAVTSLVIALRGKAQTTTLAAKLDAHTAVAQRDADGTWTGLK